MLSNFEVFGAWFKQDPLNTAIYVVTMLTAMLFSLILHECAHGWMAFKCGDPTAKMMGRLSLNPLRHLDPLGSLSMLFIGVGWARPVPVNPNNFRDYRRDDFLVSIAGVVTNLTLFIFCALTASLLNLLIWPAEVREGFIAMEMADTTLNIFNDESWARYIAYYYSFDILDEFLQHSWLLYIQRFLFLMMQYNMGLALFNLLPIPPLDGFHVLNDTLLKGRLQLNERVFQIAQLALIAIVLFTDLFSIVLSAGSEFIGGSVIRLFMLLTGQM